MKENNNITYEGPLCCLLIRLKSIYRILTIVNNIVCDTQMTPILFDSGYIHYSCNKDEFILSNIILAKL